jgi:hypothetical protein
MSLILNSSDSNLYSVASSLTSRSVAGTTDPFHSHNVGSISSGVEEHAFGVLLPMKFGLIPKSQSTPVWKCF